MGEREKENEKHCELGFDKLPAIGGLVRRRTEQLWNSFDTERPKIAQP